MSRPDTRDLDTRNLQTTARKSLELAELFPYERPPEKPPGRIPEPSEGYPVYAPTPNFSGAQTDVRLVELWLSGKAPSTRRKYEEDLSGFLHYIGHIPLARITLSDLVDYAEDLAWLHPDAGPATASRKLKVLKSLFSYAQRVGYIPHNVGAALELPRLKDDLSERILSEHDVHRLLDAPSGPQAGRDRALLLVMYAGALRREEVTSLKWRDLTARPDLGAGVGQLTVFGKGRKTGIVAIPASTYGALAPLQSIAEPVPGGRRGQKRERDAGPDEPIFRSRKQNNDSGGHLEVSAINRIVSRAAKKAGIDVPVSPHWLRHAHASHAHARGTDLALIRDTLRHSNIGTTSRYLHARPNDSSGLHLGL